MNNLTQYIQAFSKRKVLVIGDAMLDRYLIGTAGKLCREAPVPIVDVTEWRDAPGGAANTASNLAALGAQVVFVSVIGADAEGIALANSLEQAGVSPDHLLRDPSRRTLAKQRVIASSQMLLRFDQGTPHPINETTEQQLVEKILELYSGCDAIVVSDYDYGIVSPRVIHCISSMQKRNNKVLVVDSKHLEAYRSAGVTAVKPNYSETLKLLGMDDPGQSRIDRLIEASDRILDLTGARIAAVTIDCDGAILFERGNAPFRTYARPSTNTLATGAGDTFVSALTLALAAGANGPAAAELASAAASIVVRKQGTASCSGQELLEHFSHGSKLLTDNHRLNSRLEFYRRQGHRIVFTNGCFDILHRGHITYLSRAKALGDVLIVGVNSDESIQRLKGPSRPINHLEDRLQVLAALSCVDHLVAFSEDTPAKLIEQIRPDVFVKGGDYTRSTLPEAELVEKLGGKVEILPYLENRSTSGIIERIRELHEEAGRQPILFKQPEHHDETPNCEKWRGARKILCVRLDTIGDVLMTSPAIRAIKHSANGRHVTLLTSASGALAARLVPEIDAVISYEAPWMKASSQRSDLQPEFEMIERLRQEQFDAAVIFTVYSQNPLPAAFLCYLAGIPLRLAHARENPYYLLTDWVKESEPDGGIRHEVERQLDLAAWVGFRAADQRISVAVNPDALARVNGILEREGISRHRPLIAMHPGASAASRRYPAESFAEVARQLVVHYGFQIVLTGTQAERPLMDTIRQAVPALPLIDLDLAEFAALLAEVDAVVSNNTSAVHIASGVGTPVVDLYALTNPQHTPWQVPARVLFHDVPCKYCYSSICREGHHNCLRLVEPSAVVKALVDLLAQCGTRTDLQGSEPVSGTTLQGNEVKSGGRI